jgi:hypothetical protein
VLLLGEKSILINRVNKLLNPVKRRFPIIPVPDPFLVDDAPEFLIAAEIPEVAVAFEGQTTFRVPQ